MEYARPPVNTSQSSHTLPYATASRPSLLARSGEKPPRRPVADHIARRLAELFESGELKSGDRLPPERRLAEVFGVSRGSVREAIRALAEAGVLESRAGSGTFVVAGRQEELTATLIAFIGDGRRKLREIIEVRLIIEPEIARLAAQHAAPADVAQLRLLLACQRREIATGGSGRDEDSAFHATLARISGNSVLFELVEGIADIIAESRADYLQSEERRMASLTAHEHILAAVESGDGDAARRAMADHLRRLEQHFLAANTTDHLQGE